MTAPRVTFYDVDPAGRPALVVRLVEHAASKGRRLLVHCGDDATARALDDYLWTYREEAFIPHEVADAAQLLVDPEARVVLTTREEAVIPAEVLLLEAPASIEFARRFGVVIEIVDRRTQEAHAASRSRFAAWREVGVKPDYRRT